MFHKFGIQVFRKNQSSKPGLLPKSSLCVLKKTIVDHISKLGLMKCDSAGCLTWIFISLKERLDNAIPCSHDSVCYSKRELQQFLYRCNHYCIWSAYLIQSFSFLVLMAFKYIFCFICINIFLATNKNILPCYLLFNTEGAWDMLKKNLGTSSDQLLFFLNITYYLINIFQASVPLYWHWDSTLVSQGNS